MSELEELRKKRMEMAQELEDAIDEALASDNPIEDSSLKEAIAEESHHEIIASNNIPAHLAPEIKNILDPNAKKELEQTVKKAEAAKVLDDIEKQKEVEVVAKQNKKGIWMFVVDIIFVIVLSFFIIRYLDKLDQAEDTTTTTSAVVTTTTTTEGVAPTDRVTEDTTTTTTVPVENTTTTTSSSTTTSTTTTTTTKVPITSTLITAKPTSTTTTTKATSTTTSTTKSTSTTTTSTSTTTTTTTTQAADPAPTDPETEG